MPRAPLLETSGWTKAGPLHVEPRLRALGLRHGVTTSGLGNMKDAASRRRALAAAGLSGDALILKQVHGTGIIDTASVGPGGCAPQGSDKGSVEGDGWVCAQKGVTPAVYISDCLPIFIWDLERTAAGVFHAGWRGLAAGMPRAAVRAFGRLGLGPERLAAAVGPHVGACCYRVGPDVAAKFRAGVISAPSPLAGEGRGGGMLDLGAEARLQLEESGLAGERISVSPACTACEPSEFFSYRRDKLDRRLLAFITLPEATA